MMLKIRGLGIVALIGMLIAPMPLAAGGKFREETETRQKADRFAVCVLHHNAPLARAILIDDLTNSQIMRRASPLVDSECMVMANGGMAGGLRFGSDTFRSTMADALVRLDYPTPRSFDFSALPHLGWRQFEPDEHDSKKEQDVLAARLSLARYGECVSRIDPAAVQRLILTEIGSTSEGEAFRALNDALGNCLSQGEVHFSRYGLRSLLAQSFYRLAGAAVATIRLH